MSGSQHAQHVVHVHLHLVHVEVLQGQGEGWGGSSRGGAISVGFVCPPGSLTTAAGAGGDVWRNGGCRLSCRLSRQMTPSTCSLLWKLRMKVRKADPPLSLSSGFACQITTGLACPPACLPEPGVHGPTGMCLLDSVKNATYRQVDFFFSRSPTWSLVMGFP